MPTANAAVLGTFVLSKPGEGAGTVDGVVVVSVMPLNFT